MDVLLQLLNTKYVMGKDNTKDSPPKKEVFTYKGHRKVQPVKYCPVVTFDGVTPNPEYRSKPLRH